MTHRVGFTGTQAGTTPQQRETLTAVLADLREHGFDCFHHGDCVGADSEAHDIAKSLGFKIYVHPPLVRTKRAFRTGRVSYAPRPYMERNEEIIRRTSELVACPPGAEEKMRSGTWATIRRARKAGKPLTIVWPDGNVHYEGGRTK